MTTITSPVKRFPGTVVLPEFLILPQVLAFEDASDKTAELRQAIPEGGTIRRTQLDKINLPVILAIVQEWHIEGVPDAPSTETFPLTPRVATAELIAWLVGEISRIYIGEIEIPNA